MAVQAENKSDQENETETEREGLEISGQEFTPEQMAAIVGVVARTPGESRRQWVGRVAKGLGVEESEIEPSEKKRNGYTG